MLQWRVTAVFDTRFDWRSFAFLLACFVFCLRLVRLSVNLRASKKLRPIPIPAKPAYTPHDVTVIIPTICNVVDELRRTLETIVRNNPQKIFVVTTEDKFKSVASVAAVVSEHIEVLHVKKSNKRIQMCRAIPEVRSRFILFADDDVSLPDRTLRWMLAPFESDRMGGVGTGQRVRRGTDWNFWRFLGYQYIARRNFDCSAGVYMDGGLPCLSGRTALYRASILQNMAFMHGFTNEVWEWPWPLNRWKTYLIHADDDNFLTRWMVNHGWDVYVQIHEDCMVETTLETGWKFVKQCLRWSRSNWRSNYTSLFRDCAIWKRHPWTIFAFFQTTFSEIALVRDAYLCWGVSYGTGCLPTYPQWTIRCLLWAYILVFCKVVKFDLWSRPQDLVFLPLIPIWGWIHSVTIKPWALVTLNETCWGSREGADVDDHLRLIELPTYEASLARQAADAPQQAPMSPPHDDDDGINDVLSKASIILRSELDWAETPLPPYSEADHHPMVPHAH